MKSDFLLSFEKYNNSFIELTTIQQEIKKYAIASKVPILADEVGSFISLIVAIKKPKEILELGGGIGYSSFWMLNADQNFSLTTVDSNIDRCKIMEKYFSKANFMDRVEIVHSLALEYITKIQKKFDFIFLDIAKKDYPELLDPIVERLNKNAILIADNINFAFKAGEHNKNGILAMKNFLTAAFANLKISSYYYAIADGVLVAVKK